MPTAALKAFFKENPKTALGFSGGVDSSYLLYAGLTCGAQVQPYFIKSAFQPAFELADAERICRELHVAMTLVPLDVLSAPMVAKNPADRCYHCKKQIFSTLTAQAKADGFSLIIDGTNASDDANDRPGTRALAELSVRSPLKECGLTKEEIRARSKAAGLFTWDKPAYACLATRIATGSPITFEALAQAEAAEEALFALGFSDFRVRITREGHARLQCPASQMGEVLARREQITSALAAYFPAVLLDLCARP